jgi:hypothetical protein
MTTVASPYPPHVILSTQAVADWLSVPPRAVGRLKIPQLALGHRTRRYRAGDVQAWLDSKAQQRRPKQNGRRS